MASGNKGQSEMAFRKTATAMAMLAALAAPAAEASDTVYLGECSRARIVKEQSTIDTLLVDQTYEGVQRAYSGVAWKKECNAVQLSITTLTRRSTSRQELVFDIYRFDINYSTIDGCMTPTRIDGTVTGTVRFTTEIETKGELCEVAIWSDWDQYDSVDAKWNGKFSAKVLPVGDGNFIVRASRSKDGKFRTPWAFTGVVK